MSTPTATPRTQALWMKHHAFSTEEEATEALCDFRDHGNTLETELAAAQSERDLAITRVASILWSGAIDKHTCGDVQKWVEDYIAELTQLRAEVERLTKQNRDEESWWKEKHDYKARAERAEAALAFIASNGGTTHQTECGPISCNGSWCAEQARAAIPSK